MTQVQTVELKLRGAVDKAPFDFRRYTYRRWKASAKKRGFQCSLTFDQWWTLWEPHWADREKNKMQICRRLDRGHYDIGNVRIATAQANIIEYFAVKLGRIEVSRETYLDTGDKSCPSAFA